MMAATPRQGASLLKQDASTVSVCKAESGGLGLEFVSGSLRVLYLVFVVASA